MSRPFGAPGKALTVFAALVVVALVVTGCGASGLASSSRATQATAMPTALSATNAAATGATEQPPAQATAATAATEMPAATTAITGTTAMTGTTGSSAAGGNVELAVSETSKLGKFLVDGKGMTLYLYTKDTPGTSNCYGGCATAWPPLLGSAATVSGSDLDKSLIGTTTRTDGSKQITYNGWPLYYYVKDTKAGDVTGQDVGGVWYVVSPKGEKVE
jgi:predicted lipoprotein with Yx(FWY)xxD motif